ncbi:MAG: protein-disulfide reductase DsbD domain-containing protein [Candidatus Sulfotelmatobacter sp.]
MTRSLNSRRPHQRLKAAMCAMVLLTVAASAQTGSKVPSVVIAPVPLVTAPRAAQTMVNLDFRVPRGYHINSSAPKSEFLIPTALRMDLPTDIILGKIEYPAGEDLAFPFSPDEKLNVYTGDFRIVVAVHPLHSVTPGKYIMHGVLRYQACDNSACYPPKTVRVEFDVKVVKEPATHHANPAQSPHVHS